MLVYVKELDAKATLYLYDERNEDTELDYCVDQLFTIDLRKEKSGACRYDNCYLPAEGPAYCDRRATHDHLKGQVINLELIGGIDLALNRILKVPVRSDYLTDAEYNAAVENFKTDKEIYEIYAEYISDELGTSTLIPDYENDDVARYRLLRMYQAAHGKKPTKPPTNIQLTSYTCEEYTAQRRIQLNGPIEYYQAVDFLVDLSWDAPEAEAVSAEENVKIDGYKIYAYDASAGRKKLLATSNRTDVVRLKVDTKGVSTNGNTNTKICILISAYNEHGEGPVSQAFSTRLVY